MNQPTSHSDAPIIWPQEAAELASLIGGPVLLPGDDGYVAECGVYNLNLVLKPALVAVPTNAEDVQAIVRFAARRKLPIAVKSTGHQVVLPAHQAVLTSTRLMNGVRIEPEARTARIEPGVRWQQVVEEAAKFGLAPMNGSSTQLGAVGYILGGGQSPVLGRSQGYAADHVLSIDVVTADGQLRHVTADADPDLFWALRGGKGNFGVVTAIEVELFPVTRLYGGGLWFPGERAAEVLHAWRAFVEDLSEETTSSVAVQRLPDLPELPPVLRGAFVVNIRIAHLGTAAEGERLITPLRNLMPTLLDTVQEMPYTSVGLIHLDPPDPMPYYDRTTSLRELPAEAVETFAALTGPDSGCPLAIVEIRALGGAFDREPAVPNAVSTRGIPFVLFGFGVAGPEQAVLMRDHLEKVVQGLAPWSDDRLMVNFLSADEAGTPDGLRSVYGRERFTRLAAVKKAYDPLNLFRMNHNIPPA